MLFCPETKNKLDVTLAILVAGLTLLIDKTLLFCCFSCSMTPHWSRESEQELTNKVVNSFSPRFECWPAFVQKLIITSYCIELTYYKRGQTTTYHGFCYKLKALYLADILYIIQQRVANRWPPTTKSSPCRGASTSQLFCQQVTTNKNEFSMQKGAAIITD